MQIICFVLLLLVTGIIYWKNQNDLTEPWFLMSLAVTAAMAIVVLNSRNWEVQICFKFLIFLFTGILSWGVGCFLARRKSVWVIDRFDRLASLAGCKRETEFFPKETVAIFSGLCFALYLARLLSSVRGQEGNKLWAIYAAIVNNGYSPGFFFTQMREIVVALAYLSLYELLKCFFFGRKRQKKWELYVPIILGLFLSMVATDRNIFLRFAIFFVILFTVFFEKKHKGEKVGKAILKYLLPIGFGILVAFFLIGKAKSYGSDILHSLSIYGGSGLHNFNIWIKSFRGPYWFGGSTMGQLINTVLSVFDKIGIHISKIPLARFDEHISYTAANGYWYDSNVYSALRPYVEDFGLFGVILFSGLSGFILECLHMNAKTRGTGFSIVVFSALCYPAIYFPISEQLFRRFHLGLVYEIGWLTLFYLIIYRQLIPSVINWFSKARNKRRKE